MIDGTNKPFEDDDDERDDEEVDEHAKAPAPVRPRVRELPVLDDVDLAFNEVGPRPGRGLRVVDCEGGDDTCPLVSCEFHLGAQWASSVDPNTDDDVIAAHLNAMTETCVLRAIRLEATTLQEVGAAFGVTRERVRQIEAKAEKRVGARIRFAAPSIQGLLTEDLIESETRVLRARAFQTNNAEPPTTPAAKDVATPRREKPRPTRIHRAPVHREVVAAAPAVVDTIEREHVVEPLSSAVEPTEATPNVEVTEAAPVVVDVVVNVTLADPPPAPAVADASPNEEHAMSEKTDDHAPAHVDTSHEEIEVAATAEPTTEESTAEQTAAADTVRRRILSLCARCESRPRRASNQHTRVQDRVLCGECIEAMRKKSKVVARPKAADVPPELKGDISSALFALAESFNIVRELGGVDAVRELATQHAEVSALIEDVGGVSNLRRMLSDAKDLRGAGPSIAAIGVDNLKALAGVVKTAGDVDAIRDAVNVVNELGGVKRARALAKHAREMAKSLHG